MIKQLFVREKNSLKLLLTNKFCYLNNGSVWERPNLKEKGIKKMR